MIERNASVRLWFRLSVLAWGILVLFWLPIEDLDLRWVIAFAAALCALAAVRFSLPSRTAGQVIRPWWIAPLTGALAGACVAPLAVLLMVIKIGLHGHTSPDFTPDQVFSGLIRTPFWVAGGFLVGLGFALLRK